MALALLAPLELADTWTKLLFTYGPFALLVFSAFVLEKKARNQMVSSPGETIPLAIYVSTWILIFAMAATITVVWIKLNVSVQEFRIRGKLEGLQGDEQLRTRFKLMYARREYGERSKFDYDWLILSSQKLDDGQNVLLLIDRSTSPEHEDIQTFRLPILSSFYDVNSEVDLFYDRTRRTISFEAGRTTKVLTPVEYEPEPSHSKLERWMSRFSVVVHAQAQPNFKDLAKQLQSTDPIIRLDARTQLALLGQTAIPFIQEVLVSSSSPYLLKLGSISALNSKMNSIPLSALNPPGRCAIVQASFDDDDTLRYEAQQLVQKHPQIETPEQCGFKSTTPLRCGRDLRIDIRRPVKTGYSDVNMYLSGISGSDVADLYVFTTPRPIWINGDHVSHDRFRAFLKTLKPAEDEVLTDSSYLRLKLKRNETALLKLGAAPFRLKVTETHAFKQYANLQMCR
jgi:hypothetical protein